MNLLTIADKYASDSDIDDYFDFKSMKSLSYAVPAYVLSIAMCEASKKHPVSIDQAVNRISLYPYEHTTNRKVVAKAVKSLSLSIDGFCYTPGKGFWYKDAA